MLKNKELIISAKNKNSDYWCEIWKDRELLSVLVWRDLQVRYKQTWLGVTWVILQPLITALVLTIIFGFWNKENVITGYTTTPYILFVWSGLIFWNFFSEALNYGANSLVNQVDLIKKIYFPRLIIPLASLLTAGVNFLISSVFFWLVSLFLGHAWTGQFYLIWPLLGLITGVIALGIILFFSALNVKYRDVKHILPFITQLGFFLTPIFYATSFLNKFWQLISYANPLVMVINLARYYLYNNGNISIIEILISILVIIICCKCGYTYFRKTEKYFADLI